MPRLTLFLGAGGVGKTTLSAALGLARARRGEKVALLGIDPARRLRSALHLEQMHESGVQVEPGLEAALLEPDVCLRRWAADGCPDPVARQRLYADRFFLTLADRVAAAATDAIAAARAAEWAERDPTLDELIIDTAPGLAGIELVARPDKLLAMLEGRVVRLLRQARGGGRILGGLSRISGVETLQRAGDFFTLLDGAMKELARRLQSAQKWLRQARVIVVAGVSASSTATAREIADAVRALELEPRLAVLNRALPSPLRAVATDDPVGRLFFQYVDHYRALQTQVETELHRQFPSVLALPESERVDLDGLAALGASLV